MCCSDSVHQRFAPQTVKAPRERFLTPKLGLPGPPPHLKGVFLSSYFYIFDLLKMKLSRTLWDLPGNMTPPPASCL